MGSHARVGGEADHAMIRRILAWWRNRTTISLQGHVTAQVSMAVRGGEYSITVDDVQHTVHARWYDTPATIAWKLRRKLRE